MQRRTFRVGHDPAALPGAVLCRDLTVTTVHPPLTLRRGTPLADALTRLPPQVAGITLEVVVPGPGDLAQPEASLALARGLAGPGIELEGPHQGQVNLHASGFGLLRVAASAVTRVNRTGAALVATALDGRVVQAGETVGIVKAPALFLPRAAVERAVARARGQALLRVAPFRATRVGLLAGTRIRPANLRVAERQMANTLERFGARLLAPRHLDADTPAGIGAAYRELLAAGAEVILVAGSIVLDPGDPFLRALRHVGGRLVRRGAPVDPGTMFWAAYAGDVPFFGLASCELYGRTSVLDLLLPYALAREPIDRQLMAEVGYGGLLRETQAARRPDDWDRKPDQAAAAEAMATAES
ncbi:MAG: hypothetical protein QJR03_12920 [Sphaerobacter sp.]|nr:hypothetical protein [Sphaerobacter sp.]